MNYRTFRHKKSGDLYSLVGLIKHKDETTREWIDHILYASKDGVLYSRTVQDFQSNFDEAIEKPNDLPPLT